MGSELVTGELPLSQPKRTTYSEMFERLCPYYMAIGMTYDQFWHGDPALARYYRKAEEIKETKANQELWLQGLYIYHALCDVSPILHAFAKAGTKPLPYLDEPVPLTQAQREQQKQRKAEKDRLEYMKRVERFKQQAAAINAGKAIKRGELSGADN